MGLGAERQYGAQEPISNKHEEHGDQEGGNRAQGRGHGKIR
jgi:hypothetical protein